jgi:hypothetical protein
VFTVQVLVDISRLVFAVVDDLDTLEKLLLALLHQSSSKLLDIDRRLLLLNRIGLLQLALLVRGQGTRFAQKLLQSLRRVLELDRVDRLVLGGSKVEIVHDGLLSALLRREDIDAHLEFTPALVGALERRLGEGCRDTYQSRLGGEKGGARPRLDLLWTGLSKDG